MRMHSFHLSIQGSSHIRRAKECQDASGSLCECLEESNRGQYAVATVCDGHGGEDYFRSAVGSKKACEIALRNIQIFLRDVNEEELSHHADTLLAGLESSIIADWNEAVRMHLAEHPFTEDELKPVSSKARARYLSGERIESAYGTTLLAVVLTERFWFGIQIGDGKCIAVNRDGIFFQPIPWDDKCFLNATTSICDREALYNFRCYYSRELPAAVFVGSDGVDDCFSNDDQLNQLYGTILYSFATMDSEQAVAELQDYLPRLSAKGSEDDISISAILDMDAIPELPFICGMKEMKNYSKPAFAAAENIYSFVLQLKKDKTTMAPPCANHKKPKSVKKRWKPKYFYIDGELENDSLNKFWDS